MNKKKKKLKIVKPKTLKQKFQFRFAKTKPRYRKKKPVFAFNYYLCDSKYCSFETIKTFKSFHVLFRNLRGMSSLTWQKIIEAHQYHAHEVNWNEKNLPNDIKDLQYNEEIKDLSLFQFKAFDSSSRVIGLFNYENVFEIFGIDKVHDIYGKRK